MYKQQNFKNKKAASFASRTHTREYHLIKPRNISTDYSITIETLLWRLKPKWALAKPEESEWPVLE